MKKFLSLFLALVMCATLCGCGTKTFEDMMAKFKVGMTPEEALEVYGKPDLADPEDDDTELWRIMCQYYKTTMANIELYTMLGDRQLDQAYDYLYGGYFIEGEGAYSEEELAQAKKDFDTIYAYLEKKYGEPEIKYPMGLGGEEDVSSPSFTMYEFTVTAKDGSTTTLHLRDCIESAAELVAMEARTRYAGTDCLFILFYPYDI